MSQSSLPPIRDPDRTQAYSFEAARAGEDRERDLSLRAIHLLLTPDKVEEAERALKRHLARYPGDPEAFALSAEIREVHGEEKWREDRRRGLRYYLGMNSTFKRLCWWIAGLCGIGFGIMQLTSYLPIALKSGFNTAIATYVQVGRRYNKHFVPWTHPVSYEINIAAIGIGLGIVAIVLVVLIGRGAAEWEDLNETLSDAGRYGGGRWGL